MSQVSQHLLAGRTFSIETGELAQQANGTATIRYGNTVVLAAVCASREPSERTDFVPLTVDYEERLYAAGKIPGSFIRREGRPSQEAIITSRLIDRTLRPLFLKEFNHEVQIVATVLSADKEITVTETALEVGGKAVFAAGHRLIKGLFAKHLLEGNDRLTRPGQLSGNAPLLGQRRVEKQRTKRHEDYGQPNQGTLPLFIFRPAAIPFVRSIWCFCHHT